MTEKSIMWTTGSTGDGASEYTMAELTRWLRQTYLSDDTDEGVLKGYGGALAVTGVASPVSIATGGALIYGYPYWQTSASTLAIPTPSGDTRIDRVVLEADWTAQTVRITRVAGVEGGAAPALTQTDGVEWQVSLAQVSITTGGVITVTDERVFIHPNWEIEAAQLGDDLDGDGIQGGSGSALAIDVSDFAGDALADDGSENLDVQVDDATIEISGGNLQVKAGGLSASHIANRTRRIWVPATECYNSSDVQYENWTLRGWEMPDNKVCECYGSFYTPSDFSASATFQGYIIAAANGDACMKIYASYAADGEAYSTHTAESGAWRYPTCVADQITEADNFNPVSLSSLAAGDIIILKAERKGTDAGDTVNDIVYFMGFLVTYYADM